MKTKYEIYISVEDRNIQYIIHEGGRIVEDPERRDLLFRAILTLFIQAKKRDEQAFKRDSISIGPDLKLVVDNGKGEGEGNE